MVMQLTFTEYCELTISKKGSPENNLGRIVVPCIFFFPKRFLQFSKHFYGLSINFRQHAYAFYLDNFQVMYFGKELNCCLRMSYFDDRQDTRI